MLSKLSISNYALIQELSINFFRGLNTVTGETGAGKSIILGALGLILGNRADLSVLKSKDEKCIVEGQFEIGDYKIENLFKENDLDYDPVTILRREITPSGKSRAFVNDTPVNLKTMQDLGLKLIDIHSQHQNLELGNRSFQLDLVDSVSGSAKLLKEYQELYSEYQQLQNELADIIQKSETEKTDLDYYEFQFNQLNEANLQVGEQDDLEAEQAKLNHAEEIKGAFLQVQQMLDDERFSVIKNVKECRKILENIQNYIPGVPDLLQRLQSVQFELKDIFEESGIIAEKTDNDPRKLEQINERLNLLYSLQQKYHVPDITELITIRDSLNEKISQVVGYDDEIKKLKNELSKCREKLQNKGLELSQQRRNSFGTIEENVVRDLQQLGIPKAKFEVKNDLLNEFGPVGLDSVSFLFSANADSIPAEISKIASGGEMSRLMLAIKNLLRKSKSLPTVIFDEIDSGISGEVAVKMGNILKSFAQTTQIINITHLPQIAAKGDSHFVVYKFEENGKTFTSIKQLEERERVEELAKMVSGENLTDSTLKTAKELLGG